MEFYVLMECEEILGAFLTLEECLTWKPTRELLDPLVIHRIRRSDDQFRIQKIPVIATNFLVRE